MIGFGIPQGTGRNTLLGVPGWAMEAVWPWGSLSGLLPFPLWHYYLSLLQATMNWAALHYYTLPPTCSCPEANQPWTESLDHEPNETSLSLNSECQICIPAWKAGWYMASGAISPGNWSPAWVVLTAWLKTWFWRPLYQQPTVASTSSPAHMMLPALLN